MDIESLREYCLQFPQTTECFPFDETTLVFKVAGKMFLYTDISSGNKNRMNVKCDPERAIELREQYEDVEPGYHANKKYWNTIRYDRIKESLLKEWIRHSYLEVVQKFPRRQRDEILQQLAGMETQKESV
ncbi:MAG: MmcQ/YjbR family DNA-binding protein [Coprobacter sp.]|nr:MmcQ/YjbR family DNA-binding protein [Coprobacter sp.]